MKVFLDTMNEKDRSLIMEYIENRMASENLISCLSQLTTSIDKLFKDGKIDNGVKNTINDIIEDHHIEDIDDFLGD